MTFYYRISGHTGTLGGLLKGFGLSAQRPQSVKFCDGPCSTSQTLLAGGVKHYARNDARDPGASVPKLILAQTRSLAWQPLELPQTHDHQRAKSRNPSLSPNTVMCPLQGVTSSSWTTSPACNCLVSPSVTVIENVPSTTVNSWTAGVGW